jgi:hypothetical protein
MAQTILNNQHKIKTPSYSSMNMNEQSLVRKKRLFGLEENGMQLKTIVTY